MAFGALSLRHRDVIFGELFWHWFHTFTETALFALVCKTNKLPKQRTLLISSHIPNVLRKNAWRAHKSFQLKSFSDLHNAHKDHIVNMHTLSFAGSFNKSWTTWSSWHDHKSIEQKMIIRVQISKYRIVISQRKIARF